MCADAATPPRPGLHAPWRVVYHLRAVIAGMPDERLPAVDPRCEEMSPIALSFMAHAGCHAGGPAMLASLPKDPIGRPPRSSA